MADEADERYMRVALRLALRGAGRTSPNPMVGAVLVRSRKIVATGYHARAGEDHAEIVALKRAGAQARGATLYVNLEPCNHFGRTPPCTRALIAAGVKQVVAGMADPNPLVSGRGIRRLRRAGVRVEVGVLERDCRRVNEAYIKYITRGLPFVIVKLAATLDGKIATAVDDSQWITGPAARRYVHQMRNRVDAVLVGLGTVIADDPRLTCRLPGGRDPMRIVLDAHLRIPSAARVLHQRGVERTIVVAGSRAPMRRVKEIRSLGAQVRQLRLKNGGIPFRSILKRSAKLGLLSVMIEGGATTATRAMEERVVDKVLFFYGPKIIGADGKSMIESLGVKKLSGAQRVKDVEVSKLGNDLLVSGYL